MRALMASIATPEACGPVSALEATQKRLPSQVTIYGTKGPNPVDVCAVKLLSKGALTG